jgi:hypothetical protein
MNKKAAELKRQNRERMRAAGFVIKQIWVRPADWPLVQKLVNKLRKQERS